MQIWTHTKTRNGSQYTSRGCRAHTDILAAARGADHPDGVPYVLHDTPAAASRHEEKLSFDLTFSIARKIEF